MQLLTARPWALLLGLSLGASAISPARADATYDRIHDQIVGSYFNTNSRDNYRFRSNGTYTFTAGRQKNAGGNVSHSGRWSLFSYNLKVGETDDCVVRLRSTSRVVLEGKRHRTLKAHRAFSLKIAVPKDGEGADTGFLLINGQLFNLS